MSTNPLHESQRTQLIHLLQNIYIYENNSSIAAIKFFIGFIQVYSQEIHNTSKCFDRIHISYKCTQRVELTQIWSERQHKINYDDHIS